VHLLPYHALGKPKYRALGRDYALEDMPPMKAEQTEAAAEIIRFHGLIVRVGG
jgi:pyruvate formate lyase activating enzyme